MEGDGSLPRRCTTTSTILATSCCDSSTDTNALRGLAYLARSMQAASGDARLALAGYNGGTGVIPRGEDNWPAETQRYVYFGAPMYEDARSAAPQSGALDEWYNRYGVSLCRRAAEDQ